MSVLFPDACQFCGALVDKGARVCSKCVKSLPIIKGEICTRCGLELSNCFCKIGDFAFESNIAPYRYEGPAKAIICRYKFLKLPQLATPMSAEMVAVIKRSYATVDFDCVTYVPMTFFKFFKRRFNQSYLLANSISKELDIPLEKVLLKKPGAKTQKHQNRRERFKNIRNKFCVRSDVHGKTILLVDDVMTTGATLSECARVLKLAGAKRILTVTYAITYKK